MVRFLSSQLFLSISNILATESRKAPTFVGLTRAPLMRMYERLSFALKILFENKTKPPSKKQIA